MSVALQRIGAMLLLWALMVAAQPVAAQPVPGPAKLAGGEVNVLGERGAQILLDGVAVGKLPLSAPLSVSAGAHRISMTGGGSTMVANIEVRPGRVHDVRFDRASGAAMVSTPPAALVLASYRGGASAAQAKLLQAVAQAMAQERLIRFDHSLLPKQEGAAACLEKLSCQLELANQQNLPYILTISVDRDENGTDWRLDERLINTAVGEAAATQEQRCNGCSVDQISDRLLSTTRLLIAQGTARTAGHLEVSSDPAGATVEIDGHVLGETPLARNYFAGTATLVVKLSGYLSERRSLTIEEGGTARLEVSLQMPEPPPPPLILPEDPPKPIAIERSPRPRWRLAVGGVMLGVGGVFLGFGISALKISGQCIDEVLPPVQRCDHLYDTKSLGTGLTIVGAALSLGGVVLLAIPGERRPVRSTTFAARLAKSTPFEFGRASSP